MNTKGFTLMELLVAVLIMTMLVTMAVPLYEKTVEKSRGAEARVLLKRISDSKSRLLASMEKESFNGNIPTTFTANSLDVKINGTASGQGQSAALNTDTFTYRFFPTSNPDMVCCSRIDGDTAGVAFWYEAADDGGEFYCTGGEDKCGVYSMISKSTAACK